MFLNRALLLSFLLILFIPASGKRMLYATNQALNKVYVLSEGADVRFSYTGYLGQKAEFRGQIVDINDTAITAVNGIFKKKDTLYLLVKDIDGFRPYSNARILAKSATEIALFTGSALLFTAVLVPSPISPVARIGLSVGVALVSYQVVKWGFPDRVKFTRDKGWSFVIRDDSSLK